MRGLIRIKAFLFVGPSIPSKDFLIIGYPKLVKFDKDLIVIAGHEAATIYKLECVNGQYQWQLMNVKLKKVRHSFVAAMIPTTFGNLY